MSYIAFYYLFSPLIPLINKTSARRFEICDSRNVNTQKGKIGNLMGLGRFKSNNRWLR